MSADTAPIASRQRPHWLVVGLATVGVVALAGFLLLLFALGLLGGSWGGRQEPAKVAVGAGRTIFVVGQVSDIAGTDLVRIEILADRSDRISSGSYGSNDGSSDRLRNILLLDKSTGATRPILPNNGRQIVSNRFLPAKADRSGEAGNGKSVAVTVTNDNSDSPPPAYYLLALQSSGVRPGAVEAERSPQIDLLVGTLANGRQAVVMRGIDAIESSWMQSTTQLGMIVRDDLALHYRIVDIPSLRVVTSRKVDIG